MKIAIIGPGAMGRLFAWVLTRDGHQPLLICRRAEQVEAFRREGLTVVDLQGEAHRLYVEAALGLTRDAEIDGAIVTVKSYDTRAAGNMLYEAGHDVPVLSLQNGLGNAETLAEFVTAEQLAIGLTTHGAMAEGTATVLYKGQGQTVIGNGSSASTGHAAQWWAKLLNGCGHPVQTVSDIRTEVWSKAMVNIGINPFTALWGLRNGELLARPDLLPLMERAVQEAESVAATEGIALANSMTRVLEVCRLTTKNQSSMLQDRLRGRRTEIDALSGVVVQLGVRHGIATPVNRLLLQLLNDPNANTEPDRLLEHFLGIK